MAHKLNDKPKPLGKRQLRYLEQIRSRGGLMVTHVPDMGAIYGTPDGVRFDPECIASLFKRGLLVPRKDSLFYDDNAQIFDARTA